MIHFVGAGPGAVDLITVRGMRLLEEADVIIYAGSLVNPQLLSYAKKDPEIYDSSKMTLEEVADVMLTRDAEDKSIVRLHTGDQSIYGAVREQMDILEADGRDYDSCPGVSACFAAASSLNIEYTLPGVTQTLIITRMEGRTDVPGSESIDKLAAHKTSMAIYLSASLLGTLSQRLMEGGLTADTPAAIVYKASWPEEKCFVCTVSTLEKTGSDNGISKTAVVLVGDIITHGCFNRSKLYDPQFSTEFRKARRKDD